MGSTIKHILSKVELTVDAYLTARQARVRVQAMLDMETSERVKAQALRKGVSVSAMAAILIKSALDTLPDEEQVRGDVDLENKIRSIISLAEERGLL